MEGLDLLRSHVSRLAARKLGRDSRQPAELVGEMRADGLLADIFILPTDSDEMEYLQDPVTGQPFFMVGVSAVDGPDPIA